MTSLLLLTLLARADGGALLLTVGGMDDDCCAEKVATALSALPFAVGVSVDPTRGLACFRLNGVTDPALLRSRLSEAGGYTVVLEEARPTCPEGLVAHKTNDPWAGAAGLDVVVISHGEEVDLKAHRALGKYTVYDFGAPWCAPCHTVAASLKAALAGQADLAVRVISLDGADAKVSFGLPVAKQQLQWAEGLPWLIVVNPKGKTVYQGSDPDAAIAATRR